MPELELLRAIVENPQASGLIVALGGLFFQQWEIRQLQASLNDCNAVMIKRVAALEEELRATYRKLLKKTDLT